MNLNKNYIILLAVALSMTSCRIADVYKEPEVKNDAIYRTEKTQTDSLSISTISWKEFFTDRQLQNLIIEGLNNNVDIKNAVLKIAESQASLRQAKLGYYPTVDGSLKVTRAKQSLKALNLGSFANQVNLKTTILQLAASSSWEADIWGKIGSFKRQALVNYLETEAAQRAVKTQLISNIVTNYYLLLSLDKQLDITQETIQNRTKDVETMIALKESAVVTGAAVVQSQANKLSAQVSVPDLKRQIRETENAISILLGRTPDKIERTTLESQITASRINVGISSDLLKNRPDIQQAELKFRSAFEEVNIARANFYPSFTLTAEGGFSTLKIKDFFNNSIFYNLIGGLAQPIFSQGKNKATLTIAKAQKQAAFNTYQQSILNAGKEVSDALYSYENALEKQNIRKEQILYLNKSVDYTKELLNFSSNTNYTDVLTSEQNLLAARLSSIDDKLQELQAIIDLYISLGGGV
ncbi:efflux transporter outer membrane subunit [Flavobacterium branchiarum]|uniref:Efflux transporter outer membrane subunit n=1 Tax=Flavobacterium branchiarum TaxID=1114870 RepID=A0ABV5FRD8_9FLAO|nr:efflux transporter outer membrane subunit [Flavobacterium branchiarum]MDN3672817.1 efflux transporter outer membrane subunit [Flavobacterium branchiarum]